MKIADMRHRITFQKLLDKQDEYGESNEWEDVKIVWADVRPLSGKQFFQAKQINAEISHSIFIRYQDGIKTNMRIKFKDRYFEILYIINVEEKNKYLKIYCRELIS